MNKDTEEAMGQLQNGASKVADEVGNFREELSGKTQAINNKLFLQQKELEETSVAKKELALKQKLAQLGNSAGYSLLETAGDAQKSHDDEKQALLAFNAKMETENSKLEGLDDALDKKVATLQSALQQLQLRAS